MLLLEISTKQYCSPLYLTGRIIIKIQCNVILSTSIGVEVHPFLTSWGSLRDCLHFFDKHYFGLPLMHIFPRLLLYNVTCKTFSTYHDILHWNFSLTYTLQSILPPHPRFFSVSTSADFKCTVCSSHAIQSLDVTVPFQHPILYFTKHLYSSAVSTSNFLIALCPF